MEKFVVRGDAASDVSKLAPAERGKGRMRQTRIVDGSKVVVEEEVQHLTDELDEAKSEANMLSILEALEGQFISLEMLEKTKIGVSLTRLERRSNSVVVKENARKLLKIWKYRANKAIRRRERRVRIFGRNAGE